MDTLARNLALKRQVEKLRDNLTTSKGILTAEVSGLGLVREDLQEDMAIGGPGIFTLHHLRDSVGRNKGLLGKRGYDRGYKNRLVYTRMNDEGAVFMVLPIDIEGEEQSEAIIPLEDLKYILRRDRRLRMNKAFEEEQHPRDESGKFTESGVGGGASQYRFDPKDPKWSGIGRHSYAIKMKDGTIYADPKALHHGDVVNNADLDPDDIVDGGYILGDGKYHGGQSDAVQRMIAQREPKDKPKTEKADSLVWEPSRETLGEALPRNREATKAPKTQGGPPTPKKVKEDTKEPHRGDVAFGQKHQEPTKNPHRTPPAGMGMVSDSYRVGTYYQATPEPDAFR